MSENSKRNEKEYDRQLGAAFAELSDVAKRDLASGVSHERVYNDLTIIADKIMSSDRVKSVITCGSCSFCCHSKIGVSSIEEKVIVEYIKANNIKPNYYRAKIQAERPDNLTWAEKACPLLDDKTKLCSIYEARPILCRIHNSTDDPDLCDKGKHGDITNAEIISPQLDAIMLTNMTLEDNSAFKFNNIHDVISRLWDSN